MFKSIARVFGIGGASVETTLESSDTVAGGRLSGEIRITGGTSRQEIRKVVLQIVTRCLVETTGDNKVHGEIVVAEASFVPDPIEPGAIEAFPFEIVVPASAPLSVGSVQSVLKTRLDVPGAIDPRDSDPIRILPSPVMSAVFDGMERAGFRLVEAEVEHNPRRSNPFVQEFDFKPRSSRDWGVEEVEISFVPIARGVEVLLTVDSRGGFFGVERERKTTFRLTEADIGRFDLASELRRAIDRLR